MSLPGFGRKKQAVGMSLLKRVFVPGFVILCAITSGRAYGQGDLLISPRRIVFDGSTKTHELNLANSGKDTARYLISMLEIRMKEDGTFEEILQPDEGQNFASKYLRFFPRSVTLAPNEAQTVKVQLNKANNLPEGEYRSHIYFRAAPNAKPLEEKDVKDSTAITINIRAVFGITIPAIIRVGESNTTVNLTNVALTRVNDTTNRVSMTINRSGNMSTYGDVMVYHISPDGKSTEVGAARGLAVYTPNKLRNFQLDLDRTKKVDLRTGKLKVVYELQKNDKQVVAGKPATMAEADIVLQ
jgi:P pilus assembly chaperone PapD